MRVYEGHQVNFAMTSTASLADIMAKALRPSDVPLMPINMGKKDDGHHCDRNIAVNDN